MIREEHEPVRQEEAYTQAKKRKAVRKNIGYGILADAQEPGEPSLYLFSLVDAPHHMKQRFVMHKETINANMNFFMKMDLKLLMDL